MGRPPLNPAKGLLTAAERQARRRQRVGKMINRRRRTLYKIAVESEAKKEKRARRAANLAGVEKRTRAASRALAGALMPLCNLITLDPPWPPAMIRLNWKRSLERQPLCADDLERDRGIWILIPAAPDCMLMMWVPRPLVVKGSLLLDAWGWDPLRVTEMIGLTSRSHS